MSAGSVDSQFVYRSLAYLKYLIENGHGIGIDLRNLALKVNPDVQIPLNMDNLEQSTSWFFQNVFPGWESAADLSQPNNEDGDGYQSR